MNGTIALVSGATSGLGRAIATELQRRGYQVIATGRNVRALEELKQQGFDTAVLDVTDHAQMKSVITQMVETYGRIDVVFSNAGFGEYGFVEEVSMEDAKAQFDVNLFGAVDLARSVLPVMRRSGGGKIVFTGSLGAFVTIPGMGWYSASKHALSAMIIALAGECRHQGIQVTGVHPGFFQSGFEDRALTTLGNSTSAEYSGIRESVMAYARSQYHKKPITDHLARWVVKKTSKQRIPVSLHPDFLSWLAFHINPLVKRGLGLRLLLRITTKTH
jgi:NAD(P)-dependent dehydrogenase (short-subunit alcohol dehydrogenase family)